MDQNDYQCAITVNVSAKEAFDASRRVSEWWTNSLEGQSQNRGDVFTVRFGDTFVTIELTDVVDSKKITWQVTDCYLHWLNDKTEWNGTTMNFEIAPKNDSTEIRFTHIGLVPEIECYNDCQKGWDQYIKQSLFKLITEGKGYPDKF